MVPMRFAMGLITPGPGTRQPQAGQTLTHSQGWSKGLGAFLLFGLGSLLPPG